MPEPRRIDLPADPEKLSGLVVGEAVLLTGDVYTARDATHERIAAEIERDRRLPYGLEGQTVFYAGPTPPAADRPAGAIGPTTASRMDPWTPALLGLGLAATIGKGPRSEAVVRACAEHGAVYFAAVGGTAALLAKHVTAMETVAYEELGTEALVRVTLRDFPVFVAIDASGRDLFAEAPAEWRTGAAST